MNCVRLCVEPSLRIVVGFSSPRSRRARSHKSTIVSSMYVTSAHTQPAYYRCALSSILWLCVELPNFCFAVTGTVCGRSNLPLCGKVVLSIKGSGQAVHYGGGR